MTSLHLAGERRQPWREALRSRLGNPGFVYNIGNVLGFVAGIAAALWVGETVADAPDFWGRIGENLVGSGSALALTSATAVFFVGGIVYARAWANGAPPDARLNRHGDLMSGVGAILLGTGLFMIGNPLLAVSAGVMHAAGKFGSAVAGPLEVRLRGRPLLAADLGKDLVLLSRFPAILAAGAGLAGALALPAGPLPLLEASALACCVVWLVADCLLLSPGGLAHAALAAIRGAVPAGRAGAP